MFCETFKDTVRGTTLLLFLLLYHVICFMTILTCSMGCSIFLCSVVKLATGQKIPTPLETFISILILAALAELHNFCQYNTIRPYIVFQEKTYPCLFFAVPYMIFLGLFILSYLELFIQYEQTHLVNKTNRNQTGSQNLNSSDHSVHILVLQNGTNVVIKNASDDGNVPMSSSTTTIGNATDSSLLGFKGHFGDEEEHNHTIIFLASMALLVVMVTKGIHLDIKWQMEVPTPRSLWHLALSLYFLFIQIVLSFFYSLIPLGLCFLCKNFSWGAILTYVHVSVTAVLIGILAACLELKRPFPVVRLKPPFFPFENHVRARVILLTYILSPSIIWLYFRVEPNEYIWFTMACSMTAMQTSKIFIHNFCVRFYRIQAYNEENRARIQNVPPRNRQRTGRGHHAGHGDAGLNIFPHLDLPPYHPENALREFPLPYWVTENISVSRPKSKTGSPGHSHHSHSHGHSHGHSRAGQILDISNPTVLHPTKAMMILDSMSGDRSRPNSRSSSRSRSKIDQNDQKTPEKMTSVFGPVELDESYHQMRHWIHSDSRLVTVNRTPDHGFSITPSGTTSEEENSETVTNIRK